MRLEAHEARRTHPASDGVVATTAPPHHEKYPAADPAFGEAYAPPTAAADATNLVKHSYTMLQDVAQTNTHVTGSCTSRNIVK